MIDQRTSQASPTTEQLRQENELLKKALREMQDKNNRLSQRFEVDVKEFAQKSKATLNELSQQVVLENAEANKLLHGLTGKYEATLQKQIELLTINQRLAQKKEETEQSFSKRIDDVTAQYQTKIAVLEASLKDNVKKVTKMQGAGMLQALMRNERFQEEVKKVGGDVDRIRQGMQIDSIVKDIAEKDAEIKVLTENNDHIDEELKKTGEMMTTFGRLLENMQQEKLNLTKQNMILLEKLKQSREILTKLIPADAEEQ